MGFKANLHLILYFHPIESYCESDFFFGTSCWWRVWRFDDFPSLGMSKVLPKVWGSQEHFRAKCSPLIQRSWKNTRKLLVNCKWTQRGFPQEWLICTLPHVEVNETNDFQVRRKSEMRRPADEGSLRHLQVAGTEWWWDTHLGKLCEMGVSKRGVTKL